MDGSTGRLESHPPDNGRPRSEEGSSVTPVRFLASLGKQFPTINSFV
jgi:hypothetical protein